MTYKGQKFRITLAGSRLQFLVTFLCPSCTSGQFKLLMSSSEVTRVLILECFEGLSLRQWEDTFPEDVCDENPCEMSSPAGYQDLSNKTKPLIKVLPYGIIEVNKRGFIYHVCQENILVMLSFEDPEHIVFIDFPHCLVGVTEDQIKEHGFNEVKAAISLVTHCCRNHHFELFEWAQIKGFYKGAKFL
ncbi:hypothetical protein EV421DRAFT_1745320 [Armillaria borealis]|uniref:Uncharacterized protein n=1 Tax=Armillaria borealis TaxID=47425 RepID=A0AA39ITM4_9AGAR|nr:hypothetical protein EV421DRAFT_1745320 [Armillaria borealis]